MSGPFSGLYPEKVWKIFQDICKIPHPSKKEMRIMRYVANAGKDAGLETIVDETGNVLIRKPAASEYKRRKGVILQSHMDMVPQKNNNVAHDFEKDPIQVYKDGEWGKARGTTLGADNGIGVAAALAVLLSRDIEHGPLEALFTVDEETGLTGAFALKSDMLTGEIMLNIDSEDFGVITVGCAGGGDSKIKLSIKKQQNDKDMNSILIKILGLRGGHSGVDAHEQRGNAVKLLARMLWKTSQNHDLRLTDIKGGDKHNAIPREAYAKVSISKTDKGSFITDLKAEEKDILEEIKPIDPNFKMEIEDIEKLNKTLDKNSQAKLLNLLHGLPHGVDKMSYDIPDLVETSTNLATVSLDENNALIGLSSRSSIMSALQDFRDRIRATASLSGAKITEETPYPGWKPNLNSNLLTLSKKIFKEMYGEEPTVEAIHAGLECGIIGEKFPGMDMIS
ncbi:aminoacyl-histidine dipeptidase, partial [bacterium]|nr:aminoacyl-histidine dipeptidase [bacterium]